MSPLPPKRNTPESPRILIVGYGDLGHAIGQMLAANGQAVFGFRRSKCPQLTNITLLTGDVSQPDTLTCLSNINPQVLVYCVAATEQNDENYRVHYVDGLRHVLAALHHANNLRHVFFVSSTRVYGQSGDALLSESDPAQPSDFGGQRLREAEQLIDDLSVGHTALRLSGIYGPGRTRMLQLAINRTHWPHNSWSNRIHRDDAAAFIVFLIQRVLDGHAIDACYLVTDSCPTPQHEVLRWMASHLGSEVTDIPSPQPAGGKRLSNIRMRDTGFQLRYPSYREGYATLIQQAIE